MLMYDPDPTIDEVEQFPTGVRHKTQSNRILATVMFTDIVGSTVRAAELGDNRWRDLLATHDGAVRRGPTGAAGPGGKTGRAGLFPTLPAPPPAPAPSPPPRHAGRPI